MTGRSASRPRRSLARRPRTAARRSDPRRSRARRRPTRTGAGSSGAGPRRPRARPAALGPGTPLTSSAAVRKAQPGVDPSSVSHGAPSSGRLALRAAYSSLSRRASPRIPRAPVASTPAPSASTSAAPRGRTSRGSTAASASSCSSPSATATTSTESPYWCSTWVRRRRLDGRRGGAGRGTVAEHHQTFADPDITRHRRLPRRSGPRDGTVRTEGQDVHRFRHLDPCAVRIDNAAVPPPPSEVLVILGPGAAAPAVDVVHAVSPRVFVTTAPGALPAGVLFAGAAPPDDVLAGLDEGERLFVDGWLARQASGGPDPARRRRGVGRARPAPAGPAALSPTTSPPAARGGRRRGRRRRTAPAARTPRSARRGRARSTPGCR